MPRRLALLASLVVLPPLCAADPVPSFLNEVVPVLTRQGCNQGACHGKGAGQNGFRLSLRGYAPEQDYAWMTREFGGRRLAGAVPEDSILLTKPSGRAPHEGGKLFDPSSRSYKLLADWLRAGQPGPSKTDPVVRKFSVQPAGKVLKVGQTQQLTATAEFSDGTTRDVTWLTKFDSNDAGQLAVTPDGVATALRQGETAVRASFQTEVAAAVFTTPYGKAGKHELYAKANTVVDEHVFRKLRELEIEPSDLCDDAAYLRRVSLDLLGALPTPEEVREFLADGRADKRDRLVERLFARPEFVDYWALQLGDLLQNRKERDHDVRGVKGVRAFHDWLRKQVAANRPWDELARDVLTSRGSADDNPAVGYYVVTVGENREAAKSEVVASVAQSFLGTRIGCAQCHNHPLERYTQDDYYHFAAFFSRLKLDRKESKYNGTTSLEPVGGRDPKKPTGLSQPRTGQFMKPQPLDRSQVQLPDGGDPREALAKWLTDPANPSFSGAMVNRVWRHFMGVGLVEPVDDLRATNPPTNPELWAALNKEFIGHKHDLRHLMSLIVRSRAYQLSSATKPGNSTDVKFYSHFTARRLPAEVMLDAISRATGTTDKFPGYPAGLRAVQVPDPGLQSYFLSLFGRSERVTACACERNGEVTMPQLLHLQNGDAVVAKVRAGDGRLAALLRDKKPDDVVMEELFLASLGRLPDDAQRAAVRQELAQADNRDDAWRDLFWALLNAKEFSFNR